MPKPEDQPTPEEVAAATEAANAAADAQAAADAAKKANPAVSAEAELEPGYVRCRITKFGHDKIHTGELKRNAVGGFDTGEGVTLFPKWPANAMVALPRHIAEAQEKLGNLEIQD